eukprot:scaffold277706_cov19-Tisochrysis_lutea.AAC.1
MGAKPAAWHMSIQTHKLSELPRQLLQSRQQSSTHSATLDEGFKARVRVGGQALVTNLQRFAEPSDQLTAPRMCIVMAKTCKSVKSQQTC